MRLLCFLLAVISLASAATPLEQARELVKQKRYPEARAALEKIVAAEPANAAACHDLGLVIKLRGDAPALEEALKWLAKAVELEPNNPVYLGDFGGTSLQLANLTHSFSAASRGRDAMEKAIVLKPDHVDARDGLFQFYQRAPWPLGSTAKAAAQLEEIRKYDPERATVLSVIAKANAKDYAAAFQLCEGVLARKPDNYVALYQYGRTASVSGQNLTMGLERLKKCLTLDPPGPASPSHSHVWLRIGNIQEQLHHPGEARAAYQQALKLDPNNKQASDALAKLK
jgi:tetratricopeptide (TPR) repeat protein